jgi:hypothetical protein
MAHENQLVASAQVGNKSCEKETLSTYHVVGNLLVAPKRALDVKMGSSWYVLLLHPIGGWDLDLPQVSQITIIHQSEIHQEPVFWEAPYPFAVYEIHV